MLSLLWMCVIGLVAGALARLLVPGRDPMGIIGTMFLGIVGAFVGGFLGRLLFNAREGEHFHPAGLIGATIGAIICLLIWRAISGRNRYGTGHRV